MASSTSSALRRPTPGGVEDRDDDMRGVDLEVATQHRSGVRPAEAVGAEHGEVPRNEAGDLVGHHLHEVGDRHDRTLGLREHVGDEGHPLGVARVQPVVPLGLERLLGAAPCSWSRSRALRLRRGARRATAGSRAAWLALPLKRWSPCEMGPAGPPRAVEAGHDAIVNRGKACRSGFAGMV